MEIKKIQRNQKCEFGGCTRKAVYIVLDREFDSLKAYCEYHAENANYTAEYRVMCPNCNCHFGVN